MFVPTVRFHAAGPRDIMNAKASIAAILIYRTGETIIVIKIAGT